MSTSSGYPRINIYLDDPRLRETLKVAAAQRRITVSAYCLEAIRHRLAEEGHLPAAGVETRPGEAARALDHLRNTIGPVGLPVREFMAEGRR